MTFSARPFATMTRARILTLSLALTVACGGAIYAAFQASAPPPVPLAAYAPTGALLSVESPDFAGLLGSWNNSAEQKRWLASNNYTAFTLSRLFSRLSDALSQSADAADHPIDKNFLQQIAGKQSIFAWYDIGSLEFLYITKLPAGTAANMPLYKLRDGYEQRKAGDTTFYVRTQTPSTDPSTPSGTRTVAFAIRGDYLLLASNQDLIANSLQLMQSAPSPDARTLQHDPWYTSTAAAATAAKNQPGDLRMALNLTAIVKSPYFRSYWIQQNISQMSHYSAALSDLYRTGPVFREDRVLIPADATTAAADTTDLSTVFDYLPSRTGVYRASAQPTVKDVISQLQDKLLLRQPSSASSSQTAPQADLSTPTTGDATNLDQRIDDPVLPSQPVTAAFAPLDALLTAASPSAMLTFSTSAGAPASTVFTPIHTAVVLASATPWDQAAIQQALATAIAPTLTIGSAGTTWTPHHNAAFTWFQLSGNTTLALAVQGTHVILASDETTLLQLLSTAAGASHTPEVASIIAGFNHRAEQPQLLALTRVLDHNAAPSTPGTPPPFFSGNIASLSQTFQDLDSESFTQFTTADAVTHQIVFYQWHP